MRVLSRTVASVVLMGVVLAFVAPVPAQVPAVPGTGGGKLPPVRRQLHSRKIESMPSSRRDAVLGDQYRIREPEGLPQTRRIIRPGFSDWSLGVSTEDSPMGLRIRSVHNWTPAYAAGLETGDYILDVNGYPVGFYPGGYFPLQAAFAALADPSGWVELGIWNRRTRQEEFMWVQLTRR